jgi:exopolysaccharide production protein ExoY
MSGSEEIATCVVVSFVFVLHSGAVVMKDHAYQGQALPNVVVLRRPQAPRIYVQKPQTQAVSAQSIIIRALDISISLVAIVFLAPLLALIYALIYLSDRVNPIFSQPRLGVHYREFHCHKFRTMRPNSDHVLKAYLEANPEEARTWRDYLKLKKDPRVTLIGRILRKSSLDELPQLFNVLAGEMSLVGPRPIMLNEIDRYGRSLRIYTRIRPGITGFWQIRGRNKLTYRQRVACDRIHVRTHSVGFYLQVLLKTLPAVLLQKGSS